MNADLDPSLLAELRELHQGERAPAELERSVLERVLPARNKVPLRARLRAWRSRAALGVAVLSAAASMAVLGAVYLTLPELHEPSDEPSPEDDIALGREPAREAAKGARGDVHCPRDDLPPGFPYEATVMEPESVLAGLELDTFAMPIPGCPDLVRRSLSYMPRAPLGSRVPVLLVLHDGGDSAEGVRALQARLSFEELAQRENFVVVYANAAPGSGRFPHSGFWQTDPGANRAIDDFAYLALVIERLKGRLPGAVGLDVYLVGYGSGARLALEAAARNPERYAGVAALLPNEINAFRPPPRGADTRLSRMFFVALQDERPWAYWPGVPLDIATLDEWAVAVGLPRLAFQQGLQPEPGRADQEPALASTVSGASMTLGRVVPAGTRLLDVGEPDHAGPAVRVVVVPSKDAIEVGPNGTAAPLDAVTLSWEFLRGAASKP